VVEPYRNVKSNIRDAYQKALQLNPNQPEALMSKAIDTRWCTWDWREVRSLFEKAMYAAPNNPHVLTQYASRYYRDLGSFDKAKNLLWRAIDIDPLNAAPRSALAYVLRYDLQFKESIEQAELAIRLSPQYGFANLCLVLTMIADRQFAQAEERLTILEGFIGTEHPMSLQCRGRLYASKGEVDNARRIKQTLIERYKKTAHELYQPSIAEICIALEEFEEGVSWLEKSLDNQISQIVVSRVSAPLMNNKHPEILEQARVQAFLKKMNLDDDSIQDLKDDGLL
jgi:tetratricopeptide (TPR) repeat protein